MFMLDTSVSSLVSASSHAPGRCHQSLQLVGTTAPSKVLANSGQPKLMWHINPDHAGRHTSTMTSHSAGRQTALSTSQRLLER